MFVHGETSLTISRILYYQWHGGWVLVLAYLSSFTVWVYPEVSCAVINTAKIFLWYTHYQQCKQTPRPESKPSSWKLPQVSTIPVMINNKYSRQLGLINLTNADVTIFTHFLLLLIISLYIVSVVSVLLSRLFRIMFLQICQ